MALITAAANAIALYQRQYRHYLFISTTPLNSSESNAFLSYVQVEMWFRLVYSHISSFLFYVFSLNVLSLGGNLLSEVPDSVGNLQQLQALTLCDNLIEMLPASIARLSNLKSLLLHKNRLRHLPRDIITLKNLVEVSETNKIATSIRPTI